MNSLGLDEDIYPDGLRVDENGKSWRKDGSFHREDGPAYEGTNGHKRWYIHGQLHREDGPAIEYPNGNREWWRQGLLHREEGPAREYADGGKEYWINGIPADPIVSREGLPSFDFDS